MIPSFKKSKFADRGKEAEDAVDSYLKSWMAESPFREFTRLTDTKAAGRIIKAAAADFDYYCAGTASGSAFGLIEAKQTEHLYRLARDKVSQLPRLRKRTKCGGRCIVLVLHSELGVWRAADSDYLSTTGDKGSWNLSDLPTFQTPGEALRRAHPQVFL